MNILHNLSQLGLNTVEAKAYTYLLKKTAEDKTTAFAIASAIKLPRSSVYLALESLEHKKLVSSFKKNNVLNFLAESPNRIKISVQDKMDILDDLLPTLLALRDNKEFQPSVKTYTDAEGVRTVFDDIFDNPKINGVKEYHTISNPRLMTFLPKYLPKMLDYKRKMNLHTKMITLDSAKIKTPKDYQTDSHRETRFLPAGFDFDGTIIIYGKKVALFSHKENEVISVVIESQAIVQMLDAVFLCMWQLLEKQV